MRNRVFCRDGGTSGQPGLPEASGIARQALGYLDVMAVAAGLMRAIGCAAGWSWRVMLGLSWVAAARVDDDPVAGECGERRLAFDRCLAARDVGVEAP